MFWNTKKWVCHRIAGSGSSRYPSPDLIASNNLRRLAIECKTSRKNIIYIPKNEIGALRQFSEMFGAEPWVAVKYDRSEWLFLTTEDLDETENNYAISPALAKMKGLLFEEMIS